MNCIIVAALTWMEWLCVLGGVSSIVGAWYVPRICSWLRSRFSSRRPRSQETKQLEATDRVTPNDQSKNQGVATHSDPIDEALDEFMLEQFRERHRLVAQFRDGMLQDFIERKEMMREVERRHLGLDETETDN